MLLFRDQKNLALAFRRVNQTTRTTHYYQYLRSVWKGTSPALREQLTGRLFAVRDSKRFGVSAKPQNALKLEQ
jgi:hypothetical protein